MKKEIYKPYQIILVSLIGIVLNFLGHYFTTLYHLPLWLDSFGTMLTAYTLGPICGMFVGISGNIIHSFFYPLSFFYAVTNGFIGLLFGDMAKRGWMKNIFKAITLSVIISFGTTTISTVLNIILSHGMTGNMWGDGIIQLMQKWRIPFILRSFLGEFYLEFLDKLITVLGLYGTVNLYRIMRQNLPAFLRIIPAIAFIGILLLSGNQKLFAQENYNSYVSTIYNNTNGLPGGESNDIASTNDGVIWIGTYAGLYRHNGHEFRLMNDFPSIKTVKCLYVDNEGRLFIGTNDNGLSIMINEEISNVIEEKDGLPSDSIRCITRAQNSYYYVGTSEGMAVLSISDGLHNIKTFPEISDASAVTSDIYNHIVTINSSGKLFLLNGLDIIASTDDDSERYTTAAFSPDGLLYAATENNKIFVYALLDLEPEAREYGNLNFILNQIHILPCGKLRHINSINFSDGTIFLTADNGAGYIDRGNFVELETGNFNNSIDHM